MTLALPIIPCPRITLINYSKPPVTPRCLSNHDRYRSQPSLQPWRSLFDYTVTQVTKDQYHCQLSSVRSILLQLRDWMGLYSSHENASFTFCIGASPLYPLTSSLFMEANAHQQTNPSSSSIFNWWQSILRKSLPLRWHNALRPRSLIFVKAEDKLDDKTR